VNDYILETQYKICGSNDEAIWLVAPDEAGFKCVEISDDDPHHPTRLVIPPSLALVLAEAIKKCAEDLIKNG
jgi:hypothetical protein